MTETPGGSGTVGHRHTHTHTHTQTHRKTHTHTHFSLSEDTLWSDAFASPLPEP